MKTNIHYWIGRISDEELRNSVHALYSTYAEEARTFPASLSHHHTWTGGYEQHVCEVADIALANYERLSAARKAAVGSEDDVLLVCLLHDLRKLISYQRETPDSYTIVIGPDGKVVEPGWEWADPVEMEEVAWITRECAGVGIILSNKHLHALSLAHGGWSPLAKDRKHHLKISPLAGLLHAADMISSQCIGS